MARNGVKSGGRDFLPGNGGGPGRPPKLPELKDAPRLDRDNYNRLLNQTLHMSKDELKKVLEDPNATMISKALASIVAKTTTLGDIHRLEALLNRAIGPVKQEIAVENEYTFSNTPKELIEIALRMSEKARTIDVTRSIAASAGASSEGG